jgi:hypothetical protein
MRADARFVGKSARFWAYSKFISEQVGYSKRGSGQLRTYSVSEALTALKELHLSTDNELLGEVITYLNWRADALNNRVAHLFMTRDEAAAEFQKIYDKTKPTKPLPMNKQKGEKRHPAYHASMVAMIAESVVGPSGFVDDARKLSIVTSDHTLEEIFSRRFDGALPDTENPRAVWEIKEYYGTTTFGSRVADGIYETLLDGYEIDGVRSRMGRTIAHFLFIDDRFTHMSNKEDKEHTLTEQLAQKVAQNKDAIAEILNRSRVGQCGGKCRGFAEDDLIKLCPECFQSLEAESDEIFSVSQELRLFGDVMNNKD